MEYRARMRSAGIAFPHLFTFAFSFFAAVSIQPARGAEVTIPVANAESSFPQGYKGELVAIVDEDERDGSHGPIRLFRYSDTRNTKLEYTVADLRKGMVLIRALGKDLMTMRSRDFDESSGGSIEVVFYREFFGSDRRKLDLGFRLELGDRWVVRTDDQRGRDEFDLLRLQVGLQFGAPSYVKEIRLVSYDQPAPGTVRSYDPKELPRAPAGLR